jgi:hypothetical protein
MLTSRSVHPASTLPELQCPAELSSTAADNMSQRRRDQRGRAGPRRKRAQLPEPQAGSSTDNQPSPSQAHRCSTPQLPEQQPPTARFAFRLQPGHRRGLQPGSERTALQWRLVLRSLLVVAVLLVGLGAAALSAGASGVPAGAALAARVDAAYEGIIGNQIDTNLGGVRERISQLLRKGRVAAETAILRDGTGTTVLIKRAGGSTFARYSGRACWRSVRASDPLDLKDVGNRVLNLAALRFGTPRLTKGGWKLPFVYSDSQRTMASVLTVDPQTMLIRSDTLVKPLAAISYFKLLKVAPSIPITQPRCR